MLSLSIAINDSILLKPIPLLASMKFIVLFLLHETTGLYNIDRRRLLKTVPLLAVNQDGEKLCKNCKFFKKDFITETKFGHCSRFPFQQTDYYLVDGYKDESPTSYYFCSTARSSDHMCGKEGKYYSRT
jgi:hypothetical protein